MTTVTGKDAPPKDAPRQADQAARRTARGGDVNSARRAEINLKPPAEINPKPRAEINPKPRAEINPKPRADVSPARRAEVNSGNPRITVAFPFSRIDIREPSEPLRDLAALVEQLAEHVAVIAAQVASDQAEASDRLAAQAALLARRLRDTP